VTRTAVPPARLRTAAVLVAAVVTGVLILPTGALALVAGIVVLAGAWEWAVLAGWHRVRARLVYVTATAGVLLLAGYGLRPPRALHLMLGAALAWWLVALAWVIAAQRGRAVPRPQGVRLGLVGWLVLVPAWAALVGLHGPAPGGPFWVLSLLVIIWSADTVAYFAGRRWGRRRLADRVSPGKTWAGVGGALAAPLLLAALAVPALGLPGPQSVALAGLCALTAGFSIVGDLFESLVKRNAGVKDSGRMLPGHGGILDRIDSLTAAAPLFVFGLLGLGILR